MLATMSPLPRPYAGFNDVRTDDVQPLFGMVNTDSSPSWVGGFLLGFTVMVSAFLLAGAALRTAVGHRPAVHSRLRPAGAVLIAVGGVYLLLNAVWERRYANGDSYLAHRLQSWYWEHIVFYNRYDSSIGLFFAVAFVLILAVTIPSYVLSRRTT
jgi:hypothetical protein